MSDDALSRAGDAPARNTVHRTVGDATGAEAVILAVKARYARLARRARGVEADEAGASEGCCPPTCGDATCGYPAAELVWVPEPAVAASAGCGNPVELADLRPGDVVLDLGSGGGLDALLAARRVGPQGFVWGIDMTDEMVELAEENRRRSGLDNVRFVKGRIEALPLPDASVDVVMSNCVINLAIDKEAVLKEAARVLRPGGRVAIYDMVAQRPLPLRMREDISAWSACLAGALDVDTYRRLLEQAGFTDVQVQVMGTPSDEGCCRAGAAEVAVRPAFVRARKPAM